MGLAGMAGSAGRLSVQLDRLAPGNETVPSLRGTGEGRRECMKRRAADITRSAAEAFAFATTKNLSSDSDRKYPCKAACRSGRRHRNHSSQRWYYGEEV